jgi:hypothetical protein
MLLLPSILSSAVVGVEDALTLDYANVNRAKRSHPKTPCAEWSYLILGMLFGMTWTYPLARSFGVRFACRGVSFSSKMYGHFR